MPRKPRSSENDVATPDGFDNWIQPVTFEYKSTQLPDGRVRRTRILNAEGKGRETHLLSITSDISPLQLTGDENISAALARDDWTEHSARIKQVCEKILQRHRFPHSLAVTTVIRSGAWRWGGLTEDEYFDPRFRAADAKTSRGADALARMFPASPPAFAFHALENLHVAESCLSGPSASPTQAAFHAALSGESCLRALFAERFDRHAAIGRKFDQSRQPDPVVRKIDERIRTDQLDAIRALLAVGFTYRAATSEVAKQYKVHRTTIARRFPSKVFEM